VVRKSIGMGGYEYKFYYPCTSLPCSNAAKTRNPLKFAGVPQTNETISAASGPNFTIIGRDVEEVLLFNKFFFQLSIHALVAEI